MRRTAPWMAYLLLAVFLAGGVLAPVMHQPRHARALEHRHGEQEASDPQAGSDAAGFLVEEQSAYDDGRCALCARLSLGFSFTSAVPEPLARVDAWVAPPSRLLSRDRPARMSIRAPPFAA